MRTSPRSASVSRLFSKRQNRKAAVSRRRQRWENRRLEQLEERRVMAFDLVAAYAQSETPFYVKDVSPALIDLPQKQAPQQITLRFTPGTQINPATLGSVSVVRAGGDGSFSDAMQASVPAVPIGAVVVDDAPNLNQVIIRFAETLADDTYRITVNSGLGSANAGTANAAQIDVRLDLGAFVTAVVPQPVVRAQLIDFTALPADGDTLEVAIRGLRNVFEFDSNNQVSPGRIRINVSGATTTTMLATAVRDAINTAVFSIDGVTSERQGASASGSRVTVTGTNFAPVLTFTRLLSGGSSPVTLGDGGLEQRLDRVVVYFNANDPLNRSSAQTVGNYRLVETDPATGNAVGTALMPTSVSYDAATATAVLVFAPNAVAVDKLYRLQIGGATTGPDIVAVAGSDENSSFAAATPLGQIVLGSVTVNGTINVRATVATPFGTSGFPGQPGSIDEPGHRDTPADSGSHGAAALLTQSAQQIAVQEYNFQGIIGQDPQGNSLTNQITEEQKQRAREIFEIYSRYSGIRFVETVSSGITVATGDMRAVDPNIPTSPAGVAGGNLVVMDSTENWGVGEYGGYWFRVAMHEIGHALGLPHSYDLPSIMGPPYTLPGESAGDAVFPNDYDLVHLRQMYPADGSDIDVYSFSLPEAGRLSIETIVGRPGQAASSLLDTVLTLYRQDPDTGVRTMVARNDDYYGRDSFVGLDLKAGAYYVAVTSAGNTNFNPEVVDSGYGGRSDGAYQIKLAFVPASVAATTIVDVPQNPDLPPQPLDGDRDGTAGGTFNFWFNTAASANTVFVDKVASTRSAATTVSSTAVTVSTTGLAVGMLVKGAGIAEGTRINAVTGTGVTLSRAATLSLATVPLVFSDGTAAFPFVEIDDALAAVTASTRIIRIVGNASVTPYLIGTDLSSRALADGGSFNVPAGVTVVIDAGAVFKLRAAAIDVGSSQPGLVSRAGASLQVLGVPGNNVQFTSYHDDTLGGNSDGAGPAAAAGQWGGVILRQDSDVVSKKAFVNSIAQATFRYGGGEVRLDSQLESVAPIQIENSRPTVTFNTITASAGAAVAATPNSFEDTGDRIGPELRGNKLTGNSINGLFVKIKTNNGQPLDKLDVSARFKSTDIVYVLQENLVIAGGAGGYTGSSAAPVARRSGRLAIDPGVVVKLVGSRIELERGTSQLIAEGGSGQQVKFTSLADIRFGAGGTFDTNGSLPDVTVAGDWGGIVLNAGAKASIDSAYLAFGGGSTPIEGGFNQFNVIEVHQGDLRLANSRVENNAAGTANGTRTGRGGNAAATIFVRGAQPIIVGNDFRSNAGAVVSVDANSLNDGGLDDPGRSSGPLGRSAAYDDNVGPLVRGNRLSYAAGSSGIAGMVVRGEEITVESVWDDIDIVHVLQSEIVVNNFHTATGLRLQSRPTASLVVKLLGANAGFTASGAPLDIDDRIGGAVQIVGQPGYPVILTSLKDDSVGAGLDPLGRLVTDTNADGSATAAQAGDWRSLKFLEYSNDRNVAVLLEREQAVTGGIDTNNLVETAQQLGILAPNFATTVGGVTNSVESAQEKSGDENRRLGFEVHGSIAADSPTDVDVYGFAATAGSTVWIDIDKTSPSLDSMVELLDASGAVLARSADSGLESGIASGEVSFSASQQGTALDFGFRNSNIIPQTITGTIYRSLTYFDATGALQVEQIATQNFFVAANGSVTFENVRGMPLQPLTVATPLGNTTYTFEPALGTSSYSSATGLLTLRFANAVMPTWMGGGYYIGQVAYSYTPGGLTSVTRGLALPLAANTWSGADFYSTNPKDAGMRVVLPGTPGQSSQYFIRVRSQPSYTAATTAANYEATLQADPIAAPNGATSGHYELRVRLKQRDEKPGSTVTYADIRFPTVGIDVRGLPRNSLLLGEGGENPTDNNGTLAAAQALGNLLLSDRGTISVAGTTSSAADIDWYTFTLNFEDVQAIAGLNDTMPTLPVVFDIDYADGFRGDLTISLFDDQGTLLYVGRDSNVAADQAAAGQGNDFDDLSRGSAGRLDPFLGPVALAAGAPAGGGYVEGVGVQPPTSTSAVKRYYVAISSNQQLPAQLDAFFRAAATNAAVRLQPISNIDRPVDGGIGAGNKAIVVVDQTNVPALANHVTPFTLSDVTLFVSTTTGLRTVDGMRGGIETVIQTGYTGSAIGDLVMRSDGQLFAYAGVTGTANTAGRLDLIDTGNGARTAWGGGQDNIPNRTPALTTTTVNSLLPSEVGAGSLTTFSLGNSNVVTSTVSGTLQYTAAVSGTVVTGTWTFQGDVAGNVAFTPVSVPAGMPGPATGTINPAGQMRVTWSSAIVRSGTPAPVQVVTATYTYDTSNPFTVTTDLVDAIAWQRTGVATYANLFYSIRDDLNTNKSRLYKADPATGAATSRIGGSGFIDTLGGTLGAVTGMAYVGTSLYGVDTLGNFFSINPTNAAATIISTITGVAFQGLALGPQNLANGSFANTLFSIDAGGTLRALNTAGVLQRVFDVNGDGVAESTTAASGVTSPTGLAFSPLDVNLWHPTTRNGGGMYFGFEQYQATNPTYGGYTLVNGVNGQYGVVSSTWQEDLSTNPAFINSYNMPGGSYGSVTTNSFSLAGYDYTDKPTLYLDYWLQTEDAASTTATAMRDSARVLVSTDNGVSWQRAIASNDSQRANNTQDLPAVITASSQMSSAGNQMAQELYDKAEWRQVRVDLGEYAGQSNIRLRFDFSTAGMFDAMARNASGALLNTIGSVANSRGNFNSPERGQRNNYEGFYIRNLVVGFAERGEQVTGVTASASGFFDSVAAGGTPPGSQVLQGPYQLEIRRGPNEMPAILDTNAGFVASQRRLGDQNQPREQGQFIIANNVIRAAAGYGISIDAGSRDPVTGMPHSGVPRNLQLANTSRLVPGVVVTNNVISGVGSGGVEGSGNGILFSGDPNTGNVPRAAVPFGRIVNNTIYGAARPKGVGVTVTENASPTLMNNVFANLTTGVVVDNTSSTTVVAVSGFANTDTQVTGVTQDRPISLGSTSPFVNAAGGNYYLRAGSPAIDSALNTLQDRLEFRVVNSTIDVPELPIVAPSFDLYGQLRQDDPTQGSSLPGLGSNVFKDLGAIDRVDFARPSATLVVPLDNADSDADKAADSVKLLRAGQQTTFSVQLNDFGIGVDKSSVTSAAFTLTRDGVTLSDGSDYSFQYLEPSNLVVFNAASVFRTGRYVIKVNQTAVSGAMVNMIADLAGNPLLANKLDGTTSFDIALTDVPGAPGRPSGVPGNTQMTLSWTAPVIDGGTAVLDYVIEYSSDGGSTWTSFPHVASTATAIIVTGLTNGVTYLFRVSAQNEVGYSVPSTVSSPVVAGVVPGAPTGLVPQTPPATGQIVVSWTAPTELGSPVLTDYVVEYKRTTDANFVVFADGVSAATSATIAGLTDGVAYDIRVKARNVVGDGGYVTLSAPAIPGVLPGAPTGLAFVRRAAGQIVVGWTAPAMGGSPALTDYVVEYKRSVDPDTNYVVFNDGVSTATSATISGLTDGVTYLVRVKSRNAVGDSGWVALPSPVMPGVLPLEPTGLGLLSRAAGQVVVNWTAPAVAGSPVLTDYVVEYKRTTDANFVVFADGVSAATSATITGLTDGVAYDIRVKSRNALGDSGYATLASPVMPGVIPGVPAGLAASPASGRLILSWMTPTVGGSPALTDYVVEYRRNDDPNFIVFADGVNASTSATITGLTDGVTYLVRVKARNVIGDSGYATFGPIGVGAVPGTPTGLTAVADAATRSVALRWTVPGDLGAPALNDYVVEYRTSSETNFTTFADGVSTSTSATVSGLVRGTTYVFRVRAVSPIGSGGSSATATVLLPLATPGMPANLSIAAVDNGQATLLWGAPADDGGSAITDYVVQYKISSLPDTSYIVVNDGMSAATGAIVAGLVNGTPYTFRVAARNVSGLGAFATSESVTPPPQAAAPTRLTGTAGDGFVSLVWTAPRMPAGQQLLDYRVQYRLYTNGIAGTWTDVSDGVSNVARATVAMANGFTYDFRVAAITTGGITGVYSAASLRLTPFSRTTFAAAPTAVVATRSSATSAILAFTPPPANAGGPVTGYVIQYRLTTAASWTTINYSGTSPATVSRLIAGRSYVFRIAARTLSGVGAYSSQVTA